MAIMVYDPTRGYLVSPEQARVVAYVVDTDTNQRYASVAAAQAAKTVSAPAVVTPTPSKPAFTPDPQDVRDPVTGLTPAQVAAQKALDEARMAGAALGIQTTLNPASVGNVATATVTKTPVKTTQPPPSNKTVTGTEIIGSGINRIIRTRYSDGSYVDTPAPDYSNTGAGNLDTGFAALLKQLQEQNAALMAQMAASQRQAQLDAQAAAEAAAKQKRESALVSLTDRFSRYGLASLIPKIKQLVASGANEDTIALELQDTEEYKQRFIANQDRLKKGLAVLDPGSYIGLEDKYRQILRAYGLRQFDNDNYVTQFIANDISTAELSSRVELAVQRVQNADPAVLNTLTKFYGISANDLVGYALDPEKQFQKIERQVAAAEIGAAAGLQGIQPGVSVAEQLAAQGISKAEAQKGYATIADILPGAQKLSDIYGTTLEGYGLAEAEQEVFNSLASAQRKRRKLIEREVAAFSGTSGIGRQSLSSQLGGQI